MDTHSLRGDSQCKPTKNTQPDDTGANYFPRLLYLCRELQRSKVDAKKLQIPTPKRVSPRLRLLGRESRFEYRLGSQTGRTKTLSRDSYASPAPSSMR